MLIWVLIAGMTAVAVSIVLVPALRRRPEATVAVEAGEVAVYRDQLAEIDRDLESGLVGAAEAEAARAEIARRILRAGRHGHEDAARRGGSRLAPILAALVVPVVAVGVYLKLGHPTLPDMPLAGRIEAARTEGPTEQSVEALIARAEARLAANPTDTKGWEALAPVYMHLGRFDLAAAAWRNAIRTGGATERRYSELGRALTGAADDVVTPEARAAFEKAIELEPATILPRFFLALGLSQEGKKAEAVAAWRAIVAMGKGDEAWLPEAREELARAEADLAGKPFEPPAAAAPAAPAAPGPSAADVEAAARMTPEERAKMIETMVERLKDRLAASGGTIDDWERLIRAQKLLGRLDDARATLDRARTALAGDGEALARLDALTTGLKP